MEKHITLTTGVDVRVMGKTNNQVVVEPESMGDTFIDRCKETNYVPLEDYSKFGTLKLGKAVHWRQGDFYKAVQNLSDDESKLCKVGARRIPCIALSENSDFKEGETVKYYIKGAKGHWGFRFDALKEFMRKNGDEIAAFVDTLEAKRAEEEEIKSMRKQLAKDRKCNISDLDAILLREAMEALNV